MRLNPFKPRTPNPTFDLSIFEGELHPSHVSTLSVADRDYFQISDRRMAVCDWLVRDLPHIQATYEVPGDFVMALLPGSSTPVKILIGGIYDLLMVAQLADDHLIPLDYPPVRHYRTVTEHNAAGEYFNPLLQAQIARWQQ